MPEPITFPYADIGHAHLDDRLTVSSGKGGAFVFLIAFSVMNIYNVRIS